MGSDQPLGPPSQKLVHAFLHQVGGVAFIAAIPETRDAEVLHQKQVGRDLRHDAGRKADCQKPPIRLGGPQGFVEGRPTDHIVDHIDTPLGAKGVFQPRGVAVDQHIRARGLGDRQTFRPARRSDDPCTQPFADLDRRKADAACSAGYEEGFSGLQLHLMGQSEMRSAVCNWKSRRLFERHGIRYQVQSPGRQA